MATLQLFRKTAMNLTVKEARQGQVLKLSGTFANKDKCVFSWQPFQKHYGE